MGARHGESTLSQILQHGRAKKTEAGPKRLNNKCYIFVRSKHVRPGSAARKAEGWEEEMEREKSMQKGNPKTYPAINLKVSVCACLCECACMRVKVCLCMPALVSQAVCSMHAYKYMTPAYV